jgi:LEA14-like dessication related protein
MAILALNLAACSTSGPATYPVSVQLADLRFAQPGLLEQSIGLDLRFTNPNPEPIQAKGLRFTMELNGSTFGTGVSDASFELPRLGEAVVPVTIRVQTAELINQALAFDGSAIDYRITGDLFDSGGIGGVGGRTLAFSGDSSIAVPDFQAFLRNRQGS